MQELVLDISGRRNSNSVIAYRFLKLCFKALCGLFFTLFGGPLSLLRPFEFWLMKLGSDKASHFLNGIEGHLRRDQSVEDGRRSFKIVIWPQKFPNEFIAKMYRRNVYILGHKQKVIWESQIFFCAYKFFKKHVVNNGSSEVIRSITVGKPSLKFLKSEIIQGNELVESLLGSKDEKFIVFGRTSSAYRDRVDQQLHPGDDLSLRIPDPKSFVPMIKKLRESSIWTVSQGLDLEIDYDLAKAGLISPGTSNYPQGFVDVWLASKCQLMVVAHTGGYWFAECFNKYFVITDVHSTAFTNYSARGIFILALCHIIDQDEIANFEWARDNPRWCFDKKKMGTEYRILHNSPEQIVDVVHEQLARLNGTWIETDDDKDLQQKFRHFVWGKDADPAYLPRLGAKFLREHQNLLPH